MTTTPLSKGKMYEPETSDKRNMGARKRHYHGKYNREIGKNTPRSVFKGLSGLQQAANGIYENKDTNYSIEEENKLFEVNYEIKKLISDLENKPDEK